MDVARAQLGRCTEYSLTGQDRHDCSKRKAQGNAERAPPEDPTVSKSDFPWQGPGRHR